MPDHGDLVVFATTSRSGARIHVAGYFLKVIDTDFQLLAVVPEATGGSGTAVLVKAQLPNLPEIPFRLVKVRSEHTLPAESWPAACLQVDRDPDLADLKRVAENTVLDDVFTSPTEGEVDEGLLWRKSMQAVSKAQDDEIAALRKQVANIQTTTASSLAAHGDQLSQVLSEIRSLGSRSQAPATSPAVPPSIAGQASTPATQARRPAAQATTQAPDGLLAGLSQFADLWGQTDLEEEDDMEEEFQPQRRAKPSQARGSAAPATGAPAPVDLNTLVQLETLALLKRLKKRRDSSDSDSSDSDVGKTPGLRGIQQMRKQVKSKPKKVVIEFMKEAKEQLGVFDERQYWNYTQLALKNKPRFRQMVGLWRAYYALAQLLDTLRAGRAEEAEAAVVQDMRTLLQVAIDRGDWSNALLLSPFPDPLQTEAYGGTERQMRHAASYKKSLRELKQKIAGDHDDQGGDDEGGDAPRPQKFGAKAKAAAAKKAAAAAAKAAAAQQQQEGPG